MLPLLMHRRNQKERQTARKRKPKLIQQNTYESLAETIVPETESYLESSEDRQIDVGTSVTVTESYLEVFQDSQIDIETIVPVTESREFPQDRHIDVEAIVPVKDYLEVSQEVHAGGVHCERHDDVISINSAPAKALSSASYLTYPAYLLRHRIPEDLHKDVTSGSLCDINCLNYNQSSIMESEYKMSTTSNLKVPTGHEEVQVISLTDDELDCGHIPDTGKPISKPSDSPIKALTQNVLHTFKLYEGTNEDQPIKSNYCLPSGHQSGENSVQKESDDGIELCNDVLEIKGNREDNYESEGGNKLKRNSNGTPLSSSFDIYESVSVLGQCTEGGNQRERNSNGAYISPSFDIYESVLGQCAETRNQSNISSIGAHLSHSSLDISEGSGNNVKSLYSSPSLSPSVTFVGQPSAFKYWKEDSCITGQNFNIHSGLLSTVTTNVVPLLTSENFFMDGIAKPNDDVYCTSNTPTTTGLVQSKTEDEIGDTCVQTKSKMEQRPMLSCIIMSNEEQKSNAEMPRSDHDNQQNQDNALIGIENVQERQNEVNVVLDDQEKQTPFKCRNCHSSNKHHVFETLKQLNPQMTVLNSTSGLSREKKDATTQISTRRVRRKTLVSRATQTLQLRKKKSKQPTQLSSPDLTDEINCDLKTTNNKDQKPLEHEGSTINDELSVGETQQKVQRYVSKLETGQKEASSEIDDSNPLHHEIVVLKTLNTDSKCSQNNCKLLDEDSFARQTKNMWILKASVDNCRKSGKCEKEKSLEYGDRIDYDQDRTVKRVCKNKINIKCNVARIPTTVPEHILHTYTDISKTDQCQTRVLQKHNMSSNPDAAVRIADSSEPVKSTVPKTNSSDSLQKEREDHITEKDNYRTRLNSSAAMQSKATSQSSGNGKLVLTEEPTLINNTMNTGISLDSNTSNDHKYILPSNRLYMQKPPFPYHGIDRETSKKKIAINTDVDRISEDNCGSLDSKQDVKIRKVNSTWTVHLSKETSFEVTPNIVSPLPAIKSSSASHEEMPHTLSSVPESERLIPNESTEPASTGEFQYNSSMWKCSNSSQKYKQLLPIASEATNSPHVYNYISESASSMCHLSSNNIAEFNENPISSSYKRQGSYTQLPGISGSPAVSDTSTPECDRASMHSKTERRNPSLESSSSKPNSHVAQSHTQPSNDSLTSSTPSSNNCTYMYVSTHSDLRNSPLSQSKCLNDGPNLGSKHESHFICTAGFKCSTTNSYVNSSETITKLEIPVSKKNVNRYGAAVNKITRQDTDRDKSVTFNDTSEAREQRLTDVSGALKQTAIRPQDSKQTLTEEKIRDQRSNQQNLKPGYKCVELENTTEQRVIISLPSTEFETEPLDVTEQNFVKPERMLKLQGVKQQIYPVENLKQLNICGEPNVGKREQMRKLKFTDSELMTKQKHETIEYGLTQNVAQSVTVSELRFAKPQLKTNQIMQQEKIGELKFKQTHKTPEQKYTQPLKEQNFQKAENTREQPDNKEELKLTQSNKTREQKYHQMQDKRAELFKLENSSAHILIQPSITKDQTYTKVKVRQEYTEVDNTEKQNFIQPEHTKQQPSTRATVKNVTHTGNTRRINLTERENTREQTSTQLENAREEKCTSIDTHKNHFSSMSIAHIDRNLKLFPSVSTSTQFLLGISDKECMQLIANGSLPLQDDLTQWRSTFGLEADVIAARARRLLAGDLSDVIDGLSGDQLPALQRMRQRMSEMTDHELIRSISENI